MTIFDGVILGIIEGITEFLPISSTGHLILMSRLLGLEHSDFLKSFEIIIQFGAISSVIVLYWKRIWHADMLKKLATAFLPTAIIGLLLYKVVKTHLIGSATIVLWALFVGGVALIVFEYWYRKTARRDQGSDNVIQAASAIDTAAAAAIVGANSISYKQAAGIGLFQAIAIIPGVSRSAATIIGGLALGLSRIAIVEFSFLLAVPTMLAASGLDLATNYSSFSFDQFGILAVGFAVSFVVALVSIKFLLSYIRKHDFIPFGIYRVVVAVILWVVIM